MSDLRSLVSLARKINAADDLPSDVVSRITEQVILGYKEDESSRAEWLKRTNDAMDAALQVQKQKDTPWENASNTKYPALTVAALQFHARAYPAIVKDYEVCKPRIVGSDQNGEKAARGKRIADHMNFQLKEQISEWEPQMDAILLALPIEGCEFKKEYFDREKKRIVSEWIRPEDFIVNYTTKSMEDCPRKTHRFFRYPSTIDKKVESGVYSSHEGLVSKDDGDMEKPQELIEQHFLFDTDDDGVKEPWIAVVHLEKRKLLRLVRGFEFSDVTVMAGGKKGPLNTMPEQFAETAEVSSIKSSSYFTKYGFIPSPDGGFYDLGFGHLVGPLMDSVDTLINQLTDAGTLNNQQGGFYDKKLRGPKGEVTIAPGEWKAVETSLNKNVRDAFFPIPTTVPSPVLFQLLDLLLSSVRDITSVKDIMTGDMPANVQATTMMAAVEQGLQVYSSIYKRVYRCLKDELKVIYALNGVFLNKQEYYTILDSNTQASTGVQDYNSEDMDIIPAADPISTTRQQALSQANFISQFLNDPQINRDEALKRIFESANIPNPEKLIIPKANIPQPQADPVMLALVAKEKAATSKIMKDMEKVDAEITKLLTAATKDLADAESKEEGAQLNQYKQAVDEYTQVWKMLQEMRGMNEQQARIQGMAGTGGDGMVFRGGQRRANHVPGLTA